MTRIEIINQTLVLLGEEPVDSYEENSAVMVYCRTWYDATRRSLLRQFNWSFALATGNLVKSTDDPGEYANAFALPADCLYFVKILDELKYPDISDCRVRGKNLLCDLDRVAIEYVKDIVDESLFDSDFAEALSYALAAKIAASVRGDQALANNFLNIASSIGERAAARSGRQTKKRNDELDYERSRR